MIKMVGALDCSPSLFCLLCRPTRLAGCRLSELSGLGEHCFRADDSHRGCSDEYSALSSECVLSEPLKTLGEFTVPVKLHKDVTAHLKVVIEKEAVAE